MYLSIDIYIYLYVYLHRENKKQCDYGNKNQTALFRKRMGRNI